MKERLSIRQIRVIKALVEYPTIKEAAEASGTPIRTIQRWLTQPDFQNTLHQFQYDCFKDAGMGIISSMKKAQESLIDILEDPTQPGANTKLKAAKMILEMGQRFQQHIETDDRIKRLEEKAGIKDTTRIAQMEDYYCRKIVEDYEKSNLFQPISELDKAALTIFEKLVNKAPNKIFLLTDQERVKYDKTFTDKIRLGLLREKQNEIRNKALMNSKESKKGKKGIKKMQKNSNLSPCVKDISIKPEP